MCVFILFISAMKRIKLFLKVIVFVNTCYVFVVVVLKYRLKYFSTVRHSIQSDSDLDLMQKNVIEQSIPKTLPHAQSRS